MTIRIWHQSVNELGRIVAYKAAIEARAARVLGSRAEVAVQGMADGAYDGLSPTKALGHAYLYHRVLSPLVECAREAEKQDYDAFVIGSFSEPYLREMRSAVAIPVISMVEASLLLGCGLGGQIAMIANAPKVRQMVRGAVTGHGLVARVQAVTAISPPLDEFALEAARHAPQPLIESFLAEARRQVAEGADVIIPSEGVLAAILLDHGPQVIDGAVVLDVFAASWEQAISQVAMWRAGTAQRPRAWSYCQD